MTTIRHTITVGGDQFVIIEIETDPRDYCYYSREAAMELAAAQHRPVTLIRLDGTRERLNMAFDPAMFEQHAYRGYISYGVSMTDGYYAPEKFESWVEHFRRAPNFACNEAPYAILDALDTYKTHLAQAGI